MILKDEATAMNKSDKKRNNYMLKGPLAKKGYDRWWHNFTGFNRVTGEKGTFFIEYFVVNPALGGEHPILGQHPLHQATGRMPSYVMIKVGKWGSGAKQIHNFYPITDLHSHNQHLELTIGSCKLTETHIEGNCEVVVQDVLGHPEYMCDAGSAKWHLSMDKKIAYHVGYGASWLLRKLNMFEMFWHAEGIKTEYSGTIEFDGEMFDVIAEQSFGYADKNWGSDFTSPWLWMSSSNLKSAMTGQSLTNSAIEFWGGNPRLFGVKLNRRLWGGLYYEGKMYDYNFTKFWKKSHVKFEFEEGENTNTWTIQAQNRKSEIKLILECPKEEMLLMNYEAPNGKKRHNRLWNGGTGHGRIELYSKKALIDVILLEQTGCMYGEYDRDLRAAL